jgi:hypothetical protein
VKKRELDPGVDGEFLLEKATYCLKRSLAEKAKGMDGDAGYWRGRSKLYIKAALACLDYF